MRVHELSWDEVLRAGTVIFGASFAAAARAGGWRGDLKDAYRRRVLETHPDRAAVLGRSESDLSREFRAVSEAYELLAQLRAGPQPSARAPVAPTPAPPEARARRQPQGRPTPPPPPRRATPPPTRSGPPRAAGAPPPVEPPGPRAGPVTARPAEPGPGPVRQERPRAVPPRAGAGLPARRLKLAEFLYYSGRVGWQDFVGAIAWQRCQRPAVGRIAVDFGFLDRSEVAEILERRRNDGMGREPFGEFAVRHGYLTPFQLLAMLGQQLRLQAPIGQYFVGRGLVDDGDLDRARGVILRHNARQAA